jgi:cyclophilin family peptidyl-prolyl cis-trans isomerase
MSLLRRVSIVTAFSLTCCVVAAPAQQGAEGEPAAPPTMADVLAATGPADWDPIDPADLLVLELEDGARALIRLAPEFAPLHVANIRTLVAEHYFDGLAVVRSQENYVVQWADPVDPIEAPEQRRSLGSARPSLPPEFERPRGELPVTPLPDGDVYAAEVGFWNGFPVALDPQPESTRGLIWLAHCNAMVGVGRDVSPASGNGAELYAVIGHAPRHLDRNVTLVGRVVSGMEHLSTLPRGHAGLGFYEDPAMYVPIRSIRLASELPEAERPHVEVLRTDTPAFAALVESRRNRHEEWFVQPTGRVELCNVPLPVRLGG